MRFLDRLERHFSWLSFPGFLRYYAILHLGVFILQFFKPDLWVTLEFSREAILKGEIWRLVTFLFSTSGMLGSNPFTILFFIFGMLLMFVISDSLEQAWGVFRTTVFYLTGWVTLVLANFFYAEVPLSGFLFYASVFFAFATLYPRYVLHVFMIIPVPVWLLAVIQAIGMLFTILAAPVLAGYYAIALLNYVLWCGIPLLKGQKSAIVTHQRRKDYQSNQLPTQEAFHTCTVCGRTERSDPSLEFRVGDDGKEYCNDHLTNN